MTPSPTTLDAINPAYLEAKIDSKNTRQALKKAEGRLAWMHESNDKHEREVREKSRSGLPMLTNGATARRGTGSGTETVYFRCSCSGFPPDDCAHDPREAPYSSDDLATAEKAVERAQSALSKAAKRLDNCDPEFDAFENARSVGARFCWWPQDRFVDPRLRRWRGQPVSDIDIAALGVHELNRCITNGSIIEVPA